MIGASLVIEKDIMRKSDLILITNFACEPFRLRLPPNLPLKTFPPPYFHHWKCAFSQEYTLPHLTYVRK
jgi:hypothetical protein